MPFKSTFADSKPDTKFKDSLSAYYWHQLDVHAQRVLFVDYVSKRQWTGAQIKLEATKIARYLIDELMLKSGDSCVFFHPNTDHIQLASLGVLFAGASVCVGSPFDPAPEHKHMVESMLPTIVFIQASLYKELLELRNSNSQLNYKICILDDEPDRAEPNCGPFLLDGSVIGYHTHIVNYQPRAEEQIKDLQAQLPVPVAPDDAAYVLLTSGSTGRPKPVGRSHKNSIYVCHSFDTVPELWHLNENSVMAGHLQLDHGTGTFCVKMTLAKGLKLIIMEGFQVDTMLNAIERYKISDCILGSALLHNFISEPDSLLAKYNLSSLRNLIAVGSPIPSHSVAVAFMDKFKDLSIRQAFGMTECGFCSVVPRDASRSETRGVGKLLPNLVLKLWDRQAEKEIESYDTEGELMVAGPTVSPGYIGDLHRELSRAVFQADGFYRTNDIACLLSDGTLVVKGRYSEVLCLDDGWKVLPFEIESVLLLHPAILEASVVGIPHPEMPTCHAPRAYVVLKEAWCDGKLTEADVCAYAAANLSSPKHLVGGVRFIDKHLPRTSCGKVDKRALRQLDCELKCEQAKV